MNQVQLFLTWFNVSAVNNHINFNHAYAEACNIVVAIVLIPGISAVSPN